MFGDKFVEACAKEEEAHGEALAAMWEDCMGPNPYVFDDKGNRMTKEQLLEALRESGRERARLIRERARY